MGSSQDTWQQMERAEAEAISKHPHQEGCAYRAYVDRKEEPHLTVCSKCWTTHPINTSAFKPQERKNKATSHKGARHAEVLSASQETASGGEILASSGGDVGGSSEGG